MTSQVPCPSCKHPNGLPVEAVNRIAFVNYYRCHDCGHVWSIEKSDRLPELPRRDGEEPDHHTH